MERHYNAPAHYRLRHFHYLTMAIAQYSDTFWFSNGALGAGVPAVVFPRGNSAPAQLWADAAGTIPMDNPTTTDGFGVLSFFATVGEYWIHIDTETFLVDVGMSQEQSDLSTGTASGGEINVNALNPKAVDILPFVGFVVSNNSLTAGAPSITRVDFPGTTVELDAAAQARDVTWLMVSSTGTVVQQASAPTNAQRRSSILLGSVFFSVTSQVILEAQTLPVILPQPANQLVDLMEALGPFSILGNVVTANGVNLSVNKSAGTLFVRASNHFNSGTLTDDPHTFSSVAQVPASFRRVLRGGATTPMPVTTIDPANYDLNGVLTPVGGGANSSTVQRLYLFPSNDPTNQIVVQYGQDTFTSLANATASIGSGIFIPSLSSSLATLIGYIAVTRTATNLSDPTQAAFTHAGKFATP